MKKFVFTLDKVLTFKEETLNVKKSELKKLMQRLEELDRRIDALNGQFEETRCEMSGRLVTGLTTVELAVYKVYLNELGRKTKELLETRQNLLGVIEQKKTAVIALKGEISGLEHLKDRQSKEYLRLEQKEFERSIEEFLVRSRCAG